jgi:peptide/nickel transport system substrate-binding protein
VLKLSGDSRATGLAELRSGGVDAAPYLKSVDVLAVAAEPRFRSYSHLYNDLAQMLFWNHQHVLFRDPAVRRALTLGIDRRELIQALNLPADTPVIDSPFSTRQLWRREFPEPMPFDPVRAGQLLDAAGWHTINREGIRERSGVPFTFAALVGGNLFDSDAVATVYIQAQLKRLGIKMNLKPLDASFQRVITGDYEAAFHRMFTDWTPDEKPYGNGTERFLHAAGYRSSRFAELANQFRNTFDPDLEDRLYKDLARLFREDAPAVFLYPNVYTTTASARIRGLENSPYRGDLTQCMDELWLEEVA